MLKLRTLALAALATTALGCQPVNPDTGGDVYEQGYQDGYGKGLEDGLETAADLETRLASLEAASTKLEATTLEQQDALDLLEALEGLQVQSGRIEIDAEDFPSSNILQFDRIDFDSAFEGTPQVVMTMAHGIYHDESTQIHTVHVDAEGFSAEIVDHDGTLDTSPWGYVKIDWVAIGS